MTSNSLMTNSEIAHDGVQATEARHILQVYRRAPIVLVRGDGVRVFDENGREYLDLISGVGVASLGHGHPALTAAIGDQAATLLHCSNLFYHPLQAQLAVRLANLSGLSRAFFCNSGTEAVEACLKLARRHWHTRGEAQRTGIIALEHSFHGRTFGSLSVTWDEHYRRPFAPLLPDVTFIPPNAVDRLLAATSTRTAAIIVEAIQGEGGVRPLTPAFASALNEAKARTGALIIADEVQCGLGRTGYPFHYSAIGLQPDLVAIGKALGGGVPVAAALASEEVASSVSPGDHGSTYGGNLLACRAALCFLDELIPGLLTHVARVGTHLHHALRDLARRHPVIVDVRGSGLMWGLELAIDATPVIETARRHGLLLNRTAERVIRLLPPLVITQPDLDLALDRLDVVLAEIVAGVAA